MALIICKICGWDAREHPRISRTKHLIDVHGMVPFSNMVRRNFMRPIDVTDRDREGWEIWRAGRRMIAVR